MSVNDETPDPARDGEETFRELIERPAADEPPSSSPGAARPGRKSGRKPRPAVAPAATDAADEFMRPGVQHKEMRRLKQGKFPLGADARIDLHGLTRDEAYHELDKFLDRSTARGTRCVLLICGKGIHSPTGKPVLRSSVRGWLVEHDKVLAYCPAQTRDGGGGALYALLKTGRAAR